MTPIGNPAAVYGLVAGVRRRQVDGYPHTMSDSEPEPPAEETEAPAPAPEGFFRRLVKLFGSGPPSMGGVGAGRSDDEQSNDG
jgi:hypothetical protein